MPDSETEMAPLLVAAKQQLRSFMKQKLKALPQESIAAQSMVPSYYSVQLL